jgi:glycosyltransferase involved in cell wall biosynthesis
MPGALLNLVSSRQIRESLAESGVKYVHQYHDPRKIAGKVLKIYEELIK